MNWTATASVIAALAAAAGVYFTGQSLDATRAQNTAAQQGQFSDRYTRAVDQLDRSGADHLQARLGALYALERLAQDSPRDQPTIMEVLSAFIRTTAPGSVTRFAADRPCPERPSVAPDVQAALTILGRRDASHDQGTRVNLRYAYLPGAKLNNADLAGADLAQTVLDNAELIHANLHHANMYTTRLKCADASGADLGQALLFGVDLRQAWLWGADLTGAALIQTNLDGADLRDANLTSAFLTQPNLLHTDLKGANLTHAHLSDADLTDAFR